MNNRLIRQGDLLFIPAQGVPPGAPRRKGGILAEGEATGHHHRLAAVADAEIFEGPSGPYLRVSENGVSIVHEEHAPVELPADSVFEVHRAREYDYVADAANMVRD